MNVINKAIKVKNEIENFQKQINESFREIKIFLKNLIFQYESQQKCICIIFKYNILDNLKAFKSIAKLNERNFELIFK